MPGDIINLHNCIKNHEHMLQCSWDMVRVGCYCYFSFWTIFCPFYLPSNPKNHDHMLYCFWDTVCDRHKYYFSFWAIFWSFTPLTALPMKISKKWKTGLQISSFYTSVPKIMIICYTVPEIWHVSDVIVIFILGNFLPFYPSNIQKNQNFKKGKKKTPGAIIILHKCTKNYN